MRIKSNVASIDETPKEHWNYLFVATFELLSLHLWPLPINERITLIGGLGGTTGSASDLRSEGRGFDSR